MMVFISCKKECSAKDNGLTSQTQAKVSHSTNVDSSKKFDSAGLNVPAGLKWYREMAAEGDLNKDGIAEKVIIVSYPVMKTADGETYTRDLELRIYAWDGSEWNLLKASKKPLSSIVYSQSSEGSDDTATLVEEYTEFMPLNSLSIERGCVVVKHGANFASRHVTDTQKFRFQKGDWYLIGEIISDGDNNKKIIQENNYSTGEQIVTEQIFSEEKNTTNGDVEFIALDHPKETVTKSTQKSPLVRMDDSYTSEGL